MKGGGGGGENEAGRKSMELATTLETELGPPVC